MAEPAGRLLYGILGLPPDVTCSIAREVAALPVTGGRIDACVHPELAAGGNIGAARVSDDTATHHRNHADPDVVLTLFSVPAREVKSVEQSLSHVEHLDDQWLLEDTQTWAAKTLPPDADEETRTQLAAILAGLVRSGVGFDARRVADFAVRLVRHHLADGLKLANAARRALPAIRLSADAGDTRAKLADAAEAEQFFRRLQDEVKPALHLQARDGEPLSRSELRKRLAELRAAGEVSDSAADAFEALLADANVGDGGWTKAQADAAEVTWGETEKLFADGRKKTKETFGDETRKFFERKFPSALTQVDLDLLDDLRSDTARPKEAYDRFFGEHRERLRADPKLYRRWEKLVFRKPIETDDLAAGLLLLAERARPDPDEEGDDVVLHIRLDGAESLDFWTDDKNTKLCRVLRDRWRGLDRLLQPHVVLDFGRCWKEPWEAQIPADPGEVSSTGKDAITFSLKAWALKKADLKAGVPSGEALRRAPRAQMVWTPKADSMITAFPLDLEVLAHDAARTPLLTARVAANRYDRHGAVQAVNLASAATITDVGGNSDGRLADPRKPAHRVDENWRASLVRAVTDGIVTADDAATLSAALEAFQAEYTKAIKAMRSGSGLADDALIRQAELYGDLLRALAVRARAEVCVRELWAPLLGIGAAVVEGTREALIVTPWHPLRLAEIGAKARQLAEGMRRIVLSPARLAAEVGEYVDDLSRALSRTYYADVGALPGTPYTLVAETRHVADVSLLQSPVAAPDAVLADEPAEGTVEAYDRVAKEYLDLRPHEKASFSTVLLDAESEDLPVQMAESMARRIDSDSCLRCDLVLTHENVGSLRRIYERQNRRIGHEVDASLTSEAARNFLSRLRVAIVDRQFLDLGGAKAHDVVLLQDVIARRAEVKWMRALGLGAPQLASAVPTAQSRRKPFRKGDTTSGSYLTAPGGPEAVQAYVDALHDVVQGRASESGDPWLPMQEVEFQSGRVREVLDKAHHLANWVMTYDRLADRRLVGSSDRRIIRYFSDPRSDHNVIVSAEIGEEVIGERLIDDLRAALPSEDGDRLARMQRAIHRASASLSGAIVMRAAQNLNYAQELLGLVLTQHELNLLLGAEAQEFRAAWFFLDDVAPWLSLDGSRADLLGVCFAMTEAGPVIRVVVAEAKFVGQAGLSEQRHRSLEQLVATFGTLHQRLVARDGTVDPSTWRNRLADLVLEHIDPFDQIGGRPSAQWLADLRSPETPLEMSGHSLVFVHDTSAVPGDMPLLPDGDEPKLRRRRLAQWVLGRGAISNSLKGLIDTGAKPQIWTPLDWPTASEAMEPVAETVTDEQQGDAGTGTETLAGDGTGATKDQTENPPPESVTGTASGTEAPGATVAGWLPEVHVALAGMGHAAASGEGDAWLQDQVKRLQSALQKEGMDAPVLASRLTPNSGLVDLDGRSVTVAWLERKQTELLTKYSLDIIRISPKAGRVVVGLRRPKRVVLHLAEAWRRRRLEETAPRSNMAFVLGEKEDDGELFYLPLGAPFGEQERAAPHSIVSGTTGSGKGILATSLMLDACAFNDPSLVEVRLIDPKKGVDYGWARHLPHLKGDIVDEKADAIELFRRLVQEMEDRYDVLRQAGVANIDQLNRRLGSAATGPMPRILVFFDEVANWMQDEDFKEAVEPLINEIATKSRAAGIHLFMIYQRADNQVMTMQLRTNLGNKLVLRLGDEGSSRIALGEKGAERLLGKGHLIAKLDSDEKVYCQVPFIGEDEVVRLAEAIGLGWKNVSRAGQPGAKAA
ncbi:DNA translocase FtsK [Roseomonas terrae]|uniref:DNA translocase FtsK n=1 Tax=Neoroseomonas terrae TaxID=424799 RepID=A0ABS5EM53_9PROT|nr:FtsK/SpoIIIE domain-containing protein [Neoroseomonas terrae]MBR0652108.1 DNA translocase FtsK [Neoroseomonas terrae]